MESKKGTSTAAPLCCLLLLLMFILPSEERTTEKLQVSPLVRRYCGQPSHFYGSSDDCLPGLCAQACRDEGFPFWECKFNMECYCLKFCGGSTAAASPSSSP